MVSGGLTQPVANDFWTPENPDARFPRMGATGTGGNNRLEFPVSWWLWNASYLRIKNIELGYNLPKSALKFINLQSVRFYFSAQNLLTFSHVKDFIDPEMGQSGTLDANTNGWYYPHQRVVSFGTNITF